MISFDELRRYVETQAPQLHRIFECIFRKEAPQDRAEEMVQEAMACTWAHIYRAYELGKIVDEESLSRIKTASSKFAIKRVREGRRTVGYGGRRPEDVFDFARKGRVRIGPVNIYMMASDKDPVPDQVQASEDWAAFRSRLGNRDREMLHDLMWTDLTDEEVAFKWDRSLSSIKKFRYRIAHEYRRYVGDE